MIAYESTFKSALEINNQGFDNNYYFEKNITFYNILTRGVFRVTTIHVKCLVQSDP